MLHFTCDRCQRQLDPKDDLRYVVRIEAYAVLSGPEPDDEEDDRDHLRELQEVLERLDDDCDVNVQDLHQRQRFDLCADCHSKYIRNPVGNESAMSIDFSSN